MLKKMAEMTRESRVSWGYIRSSPAKSFCVLVIFLVISAPFVWSFVTGKVIEAGTFDAEPEPVWVEFLLRERQDTTPSILP